MRMGLETIDDYCSEAEYERGGWRRSLGRIMTFGGFVILANAVLVALLFRHLLSFRDQLVLALIGAVVGVLGMLVRGNKRSHVRVAAFASVGAVVATLIVSILEERFGVLAVAGLVLVFAFLIQKLEYHAWKNL